MDPISKRQGALTRAWAAVVAVALLLQVVAGAPAAANAAEQRAAFGAICATPPAPAPDQQPADPHRSHRHGLCCILHCGALAAPPTPRLVVALSFPAEVVQPPPPVATPVSRVEPKGAPQSPRAPPARV